MDGCERNTLGGGYGYCRKHYQRFTANGDPLKLVRGATLPLEPLWALIQPADQGALARRLGVARRTVVRWKANGVPLNRADAIAGSLGRHPSEIWGEQWWAAA